MKVNGKVIVVTGAGSGIGRAIALEILTRGAKGVAAVDMNADALAETKKLAGASADKVSTHVINLTDRAAVAKLPKAVIAKHDKSKALSVLFRRGEWTQYAILRVSK